MSRNKTAMGPMGTRFSEGHRGLIEGKWWPWPSWPSGKMIALAKSLHYACLKLFLRQYCSNGDMICVCFKRDKESEKSK